MGRIALAIEDQVPISNNEKIIVNVQAPRPAEAKADQNGNLAWKFTLPPGGKRDLLVDFTVEFPSGSAVVPLDD